MTGQYRASRRYAFLIVRWFTSVAVFFRFFFNDTATTEIYTLSLHDALPICIPARRTSLELKPTPRCSTGGFKRSEEHTSELQSPCNLACRLLLEKKHMRGDWDAAFIVSSSFLCFPPPSPP